MAILKIEKVRRSEVYTSILFTSLILLLIPLTIRLITHGDDNFLDAFLFTIKSWLVALAISTIFWLFNSESDMEADAREARSEIKIVLKILRNADKAELRKIRMLFRNNKIFFPFHHFTELTFVEGLYRVFEVNPRAEVIEVFDQEYSDWTKAHIEHKNVSDDETVISKYR